MQRLHTQADDRLLDAVQCVSALTDAEPTENARERLRGILGYRLYRALVSSLVP
ncbi:MAG: hypothetical protein QOH74_41 [Gaiellales bacterium]|nr:hypothetical protein [Gaiellales bacterium]